MSCIKLGLMMSLGWGLAAFFTLGSAQAMADWQWIATVGAVLLFSGPLFRLLTYGTCCPLRRLFPSFVALHMPSCDQGECP
uniref:Uncharacterized protein n=1 Tax=Magnetococcus massalia (strain MO-1) TaxID=451514 RepID=A0A1S7LMU0_MAGMO|nr:Exported protein of unknown function [Candidatus Magnetococcus massalia]